MQPSRARGLDLSHYALMEDGAPLSPPLGPCHLFHFAVHLAERLQATPSKIFSELISARLIRLDSDCVSNGRIDFRLASKLNKREGGGWGGGYALRLHFFLFSFPFVPRAPTRVSTHLPLRVPPSLFSLPSLHPGSLLLLVCYEVRFLEKSQLHTHTRKTN